MLTRIKTIHERYICLSSSRKDANPQNLFSLFSLNDKNPRILYNKSRNTKTTFCGEARRKENAGERIGTECGDFGCGYAAAASTPDRGRAIISVFKGRLERSAGSCGRRRVYLKASMLKW